MIRKILAWTLFVLAASPVTAPFSTCDLSMLLGHSTAGKFRTSVVLAAVRPQREGSGANEVILESSSSSNRTAELIKVLVIAKRGQPTTTSNQRDSAAWSVFNSMRLPDGLPALSAVLRL